MSDLFKCSCIPEYSYLSKFSYEDIFIIPRNVENVEWLKKIWRKFLLITDFKVKKWWGRKTSAEFVKVIKRTFLSDLHFYSSFNFLFPSFLFYLPTHIHAGAFNIHKKECRFGLPGNICERLQLVWNCATEAKREVIAI